MAVSQKLPPHEPTIHTDQSSTSAVASDGESSSSAHDEIDTGLSSEEVAMVFLSRISSTSCGAKKSPSSTRPAASRRVLTPTTSCCKKSLRGRRNADIACLHRHLASLSSLLPPAARSSEGTRNVIADALRYKKALSKQIQMLQKALPYAQQVNVKRVGSGGLQIGVACNKEEGLLVALMEALESFGLAFTNVNVSCLNDKIRIDAVSTKGVDERIGSLKVALMATIMRFNNKRN